MGLLEGLRRWWTGPSESDLGGQIQWAVDRRLGLADYMEIPALARARSLIVSLASMLEPVAWADGYPLAKQPAVLLRPQAQITRGEWLAAIVASLIDHGDAFLWQQRSGLNSTGYPDRSTLVPYGDVRIEWTDRSKLRRRYWYLDREVQADGIAPELIHISINRRAGELTGHSPIEAIEGSLARILAAELFASDYFEGGGMPPVTLKYDGELTDTQAERAQTRWMERRAEHTPAVLQKGWSLQEPGKDSQASQLLETRRWGVQEIARGLGIVPGELLLAEVGGSSLTYQNIAEMLDTFMRVTVQPQYLAPIEEKLSDLVPGTQAVRFDASELYRLQTPARYAAYETGLRAGFLTVDRIERWEGWQPGAEPVIPASFRPTPVPLEETA